MKKLMIIIVFVFLLLLTGCSVQVFDGGFILYDLDKQDEVFKSVYNNLDKITRTVYTLEERYSDYKSKRKDVITKYSDTYFIEENSLETVYYEDDKETEEKVKSITHKVYYNSKAYYVGIDEEANTTNKYMDKISKDSFIRQNNESLRAGIPQAILSDLEHHTEIIYGTGLYGNMISYYSEDVRGSKVILSEMDVYFNTEYLTRCDYFTYYTDAKREKKVLVKKESFEFFYNDFNDDKTNEELNNIITEFKIASCIISHTNVEKQGSIKCVANNIYEITCSFEYYNKNVEDPINANIHFYFKYYLDDDCERYDTIDTNLPMDGYNLEIRDGMSIDGFGRLHSDKKQVIINVKIIVNLSDDSEIIQSITFNLE